jgi:hypothetical protein
MRLGTRATLLTACAVLMFTALEAEAQRRGGGGRSRGGGGGFRGGGMSRGASRASVTRAGGGGFSRGTVSRGAINTGNINRGTINRGNINTGNVYRGGNLGNRPVNIDDVNSNRDWGWDNGYNGCCYHPVAAGVAVGAAAAVTANAIGSTVYSVPSDCVSTIVNGVTYMQCGSTWYEPQFYGGDASYTVVSPP